VKNGQFPTSILDGIVDKTLVLQNQKLSNGVIDAFTQSTGDFIQKIVLESNDLSDE
jgi:hypothetical protein